HILMTMADWSALLQRYMDLNNRPLLPDAGHVTHEQAVEKAFTEYDKFRVIQDREIMSDFDKQLKLLFGDKKQDTKD
ncbi:MAG: virulence RhuM family protein, partial [Prevotella sp.]|nr:virulence RhuM family protein [Prevotella sp.]